MDLWRLLSGACGWRAGYVSYVGDVDDDVAPDDDDACAHAHARPCGSHGPRTMDRAVMYACVCVGCLYAMFTQQIVPSDHAYADCRQRSVYGWIRICVLVIVTTCNDHVCLRSVVSDLPVCVTVIWRLRRIRWIGQYSMLALRRIGLLRLFGGYVAYSCRMYHGYACTLLSGQACLPVDYVCSARTSCLSGMQSDMLDTLRIAWIVVGFACLDCLDISERHVGVDLLDISCLV